MYFLPLLMLTFLMKPLSGELFSIGVRLITNATHIKYEPSCRLLAELVPEIWQEHRFRSCILMLPTESYSTWHIIPYKITVEPSGILGFPENANQFELFDFLNRHLNPPRKRCSTLVGSIWWSQEEKQNTNYDIRMFYNIARLDPWHSACSIICRRAKDAKINVSILTECRSDVIGFPGNELAHPVMLKLTTRGQHLLHSESVHKSIKIITDKINGDSDHCVTVTNVLSAESGRARDLILQFTNASVSNNSCTLLLDSRMSAYVLGGFVNCESLYISSTYPDMGMRVVMLRTGIQFHGIPLDSIGETELVLRTEVLFNMNAEGCITYEPNHVARLLHKTNKWLSAFISAPQSVDLCGELMKRMGDDFFSMYKSCSLEMRNGSEAFGQNVVLNRLKAMGPFYAVDEPFYLNYHSLLVNNLNWAHGGCLYNGYLDAQSIGIF